MAMQSNEVELVQMSMPINEGEQVQMAIADGVQSLSQFLIDVNAAYLRQPGSVGEAWHRIYDFGFSNFIGNGEDRKLTTRDVNLFRYWGNALHLACYAGDSESARIIMDFYLEWGRTAAVVPDILTAAMHAGQCPMHLAVRMDGLVGMNERVTANATVQNQPMQIYANGGQHLLALRELLRANAVDQPDYDGKYALYYACKNGKEGMVREMLTKARFEAWNQALDISVQTIILILETAPEAVAVERALEVGSALECLLDKSKHG